MATASRRSALPTWTRFTDTSPYTVRFHTEAAGLSTTCAVTRAPLSQTSLHELRPSPRSTRLRCMFDRRVGRNLISIRKAMPRCASPQRSLGLHPEQMPAMSGSTDMSLSSAAVIVGFDLNGLGVARALAERRVRCIGVATPSWNPAWGTRSCRVIPCDEWSRGAVVEKLVEIGQREGRKPSLLITKEEPARWISDSREELSDYYEINLPDKPIVDLLLNKADFDRLCVQEGWPRPRTWRIESRVQLLSALPELPFPCILKPQVHSKSFGDRSPRKAFKLGDPDELLRTYEMAAQWTEKFILQEWIHGGDDRIVFCLTYFDRRGESQAMFVGRKLRQWPPECGNTALCEAAP